MNRINKQKFLAELGKLLTFMYEEDRQTALAMYDKMFEDAQDEQSLIQALVSPTRQAVLVARAYNAKERKLQVHAQSRDASVEQEDTGSTPEFILVINQIYQDALPHEAAAVAPMANQFSLFEAPEAFFEEERAEEGQEAAPLTPAAEEAPVQEPEPAQEAPAEAQEAPADPVGQFPADFSLDASEPVSEEEAEAPQEAAEEAAEDSEAGEAPAEAPAEEPAEEPAEAAAEAPAEEFREEEDKTWDLPEKADAPQKAFERVVPGTVRKPRVFLLILFLLLAIPIGLLGIAVLLIPTALFLALAVCVIAAGSAALMGAFSGFPVFADIMVVLGVALIVLALGLLLLWIFIWFLGGPIAGWVRALASLGSKWCYEEVPA